MAPVGPVPPPGPVGPGGPAGPVIELPEGPVGPVGPVGPTKAALDMVAFLITPASIYYGNYTATTKSCSSRCIRYVQSAINSEIIISF